MKKFFSYILILLVLTGFFSVTTNAEAAGKCFNNSGNASNNLDQTACQADPSKYYWSDTGTPGKCFTSNGNNPNGYDKNGCLGYAPNMYWSDTGTPNGPRGTSANKSALEASLEGCGGPLMDGTLYGCVEQITYAVFVTFPSFLLGFVAYFFNFAVAMTLSSTFYDADYITTTWGVIRDFANIFFILILLYAAFSIILDINHGNGKKMVGMVIAMALVVNFSLFFTKVIIDSSNIFALIFYNKIAVVGETPYQPVASTKVNVQQKDISGALVSSFNVNQFFSAPLLEKIDKSAQDRGIDSALNFYVKMGMMIVYGLVIYVLAYSFFIAGVHFFGRMVMLLLLMIVSPFAFMSFAVPALRKVDTIGFSSWIHKLMQTSFVAAIFIFVIYLVSVILDAGAFGIPKDSISGGILPTLIGLFLPAFLIITFLVKGREYAEKSSGEFSAEIIGGAKKLAGTVGMLGGAGLAVGAFAGRTIVGRTTAAVSRSEKAVAHAKEKFEYPGKQAKYQSDLDKWNKARRAAVLAGRPLATAGPRPTPPTPPRVVLTSWRDKIGSRINQAQLKVGTAAHAQHELEGYKEKAGLKGVDNAFLSGIDEGRIEKEHRKAESGNVEKDVKRGYDVNNKEVLITRDATGATLATPVKGEAEYRRSRQADIAAGVRTAAAPGDVDTAGNLTGQGNAKVKAALDQEVNLVIKANVKEIVAEKYKELKHEATDGAGPVQSLTARLTSGTYDPRNIADAKGEGMSKKFPAGWTAKNSLTLIAAVAAGIRMVMKAGVGVDVGKGHGDIFKDLGDRIVEGLKGVKITIKQKDHGGSTHHEKEVKSSGH
jgi:hypothetical protein